MSEQDISWKSDRTTRFKQPPGFTFKECPSTSTCTECLGSGHEGCGDFVDPNTSTEYKFWYPDNAKVRAKLKVKVCRGGRGGAGDRSESWPAG